MRFIKEENGRFMVENKEQMREFDKIAEAIMEPFKRAVSVVYIDADMLYDFRLGNLILHTSTEEQYQYIQKNLEAYESSANPKVTESFPDLGISEEQLDAFEKDPVYGWQIPVASPKTSFLDELGNLIVSINTLNESKEVKEPLRILINQRAVKFPKTMKTGLVQYILNHNKHAIIEFTNYSNWDEIPEQVFDSIDILFVHDAEDFVRHGTVSQRRMANMHEDCLRKIVVATCRSSKTFDSDEEKKEALTNFANIMGVMFSGFTFIKRKLSR